MELRPVVVIAVIACLLAAAAPWFSGGQEPVALMIGGMALLLGALLLWLQPSVRRLRLDPFVLAYGALIVVGIASLMWSANRYSTGLWVVEWLLMGLAFRLSYIVSGEPKGREWIARGYLASAAIFCVVALWMFLTVVYPRLTGTFYWPNPAAAYLIPAILMSLDRLRLARGRAALLWGAAATLFTGSFLLTDSRAAILVLVLMVAIYLMVVSLKRVSWTRIVFVFLLAILSSILLTNLSTITAHRSNSAIPGSRFAEAANGESRSLTDRVLYLASAAKIWSEHPLLGSGAGTYGDVHPQSQQRVVSAATSAHNIYAQTVSDLGIVGGLALLITLIALAGGTLRGLVRGPALLPVALGLAGLLLHFGLDIDAHYPALLVLCGVLAGLVYAQREESRAGLRWTLPAVAAVLLVPLVSLYQSDTWADSAKAAAADEDFVEAASRYGLANRGVLYNPDNVGAEGIALFALAAGYGPDATQAKASGILALQRARKAESLDPHDGQHHQLEGRLLSYMSHLKDAEAQFKRALALDPYNHPDYATDLASTQLRMGDADTALKTANEMLELYPDDVVANRSADPTIPAALSDLEVLAGSVYLQRGDLHLAGIAARRALRLTPKSVRAKAFLDQVDKAGQITH